MKALKNSKLINHKHLISRIYQGQIRHRRYATCEHNFNYNLFMLALDVDEVCSNKLSTGIFGYRWFHLLRFVEKDYVLGEPKSLKQRITNKLRQLGANWQGDNITMLVQVRCFGFYFSPANFYFCYDENEQGQQVCRYMLVEVSNIPWNERHYYLVDPQQEQDTTDKTFHVSPFMDLNMKYLWRVKPPSQESKQVVIHIENHKTQLCSEDKFKCGVNPVPNKLFDATLALTKREFSKSSLYKVWLSLPFMTGKIVLGIYFQALKLFIKKIPFIPYERAK